MQTKKRTILFLLNRECTFLPPFMTMLEALCDTYCLKVISCEKSGGKKKLESFYKGKDITFLSCEIQKEPLSLAGRICRRVRNDLHIPTAFHKEAAHIIKETPHDLLWVIHEETAYEFKELLKGRRYIISLYELNDHRHDFLEKIKLIIQNAQEVIVPEYNRACILRVWLNLDTTPTVIPNKPLNHPRRRNISSYYSKQLEGKKIVLYQGYINRSRNLDKVCDAVKDMPGYCIVLMGKGDESYIQELKDRYPMIIHISFIAPPEHLNVTSWAHIAIVKYDFVVLNAIFCAPNKTWEYTGFGVPVLCHDIPGLRYSIGHNEAGICTNLDDVESIKAAISSIDSNYDYYSQKALKYYESFDVRSALLDVINKHC